MRIRSDLLKFRAGLRDDAGERIEPEQQRVQRVIGTDAAVGGTQGQELGQMNAEIIAEGTAGEFAGAVRTPCFGCKHFDRRTWREYVRKAEGPLGSLEDRRFINLARAALLDSRNATIHDRHQSMEGDMDVEHAIMHMGLCRPMTEIDGGMIVVYPTSTCPVEVVTPERPQGFYEAKDRESARIGSAAYDAVMKRAMGKVE